MHATLFHAGAALLGGAPVSPVAADLYANVAELLCVATFLLACDKLLCV